MKRKTLLILMKKISVNRDWLWKNNPGKRVLIQKNKQTLKTKIKTKWNQPPNITTTKYFTCWPSNVRLLFDILWIPFFFFFFHMRRTFVSLRMNHWFYLITLTSKITLTIICLRIWSMEMFPIAILLLEYILTSLFGLTFISENHTDV